MKTEFTMQEAREFLSWQEQESDIVRLVDPKERLVLSKNASSLQLELTEQEKKESSNICSAFWGRCDRCENCTSLRALQDQSRAYKIELNERHTFLVCSRFIKIDGHACIVETLNDVTDTMLLNSNQYDTIGRMIKDYNFQLITDPLTGVYNRRFLDEQFLPSLDCCHDSDLQVNLAFLDMDDFKQVNDFFGHRAGDILLKDTAGFWKLHYDSRIKNMERLVIRMGGDEFLIIACGMDFPTFRDEVKSYYSQMRRICYVTDKVQIPFGMSFGFASSKELGDMWSWDELLGLADKRMYESKMQHNH